MRRQALLYAACGWLTCALLSHSLDAADKPDFEPVPGFVKLPQSITLGACSAVAVNNKGEIYLFHRGRQPIICLAADGSFLSAWGDDSIAMAHGLRIDQDDNVWVTDIENHQVYKFSASGELLMSLGKAGKFGDGADEFNKPTDIAFAANGEIFVSDGYGNSRVMKFTPHGEFLQSWGEPGDGPGEFNLPHAIAVDRRGRVIVGDRENDRLQVFDQKGKLQEVWPGFAPFGIALDKQGRVFVADGRAHKVLLVDDRGQVVDSWGEEGTGPGEFQLPHMLAADSRGSLFVAEVTGKRLQKLQRR